MGFRTCREGGALGATPGFQTLETLESSSLGSGGGRWVKAAVKPKSVLCSPGSYYLHCAVSSSGSSRCHLLPKAFPDYTRLS